MNSRRGISGDIKPTRRLLPKQAIEPKLAPAPVSRAPLTKPAVRSFTYRRDKLWDLVQYPLFAVIAITASVNNTFGQLLIGVYAVIVIFIRRRPSSLSFGLALIILISVPIFNLIGQSSIAENAAIYVYELLVVGTIQAIVELKQTA